MSSPPLCAALSILVIFASAVLHSPAEDEDSEHPTGRGRARASAKTSPRAGTGLSHLRSGHVRCRSWHGDQAAAEEGVLAWKSLDGSPQLDELLGVHTWEVVNGTAECSEVRVRHRQQKQLPKSRLGPREGSEQHGCLGTGGDNQGIEHPSLQAEKFGGAENESLLTGFLSKPQEACEQSGSQAIVTPEGAGALDLPQGDAVISVTEEMGIMEDTMLKNSEREEMNGHLKFSYFATSISGAGIISIYTGFVGDKTGHTHDVYLKVCTISMMAAFTSGASMILLTFPCLSRRVPIQIIKRLKYTTLGYLILAVLDICIMFLKRIIVLAILLAFLPTLVVMIIELVLGLLKNRFSQTHHGFNSSLQIGRFLPLSSVV